MPESHPYVVLDIDTFEDQYQPVDASDGSFYHNPEDLEGLDPHLIWSASDDPESEGVILTCGEHLVNVFAYVVTSKPWPDEQTIEVLIPGVGTSEPDEDED